MAETAHLTPSDHEGDEPGLVIDARFQSAELEEILDLDDTDMVAYLLSRLYHPATKAGDTAFLLIESTTPDKNDPLRQRWSRILDESPLFDADKYDTYRQNEIIAELEAHLIATRNSRDRSEERVAVRILMQLAATLINAGHSTESIRTVFMKMLQDSRS